MKLVDVKSGTYIEFGGENNDKYPKSEVDKRANIKIQKYYCKRLHSELV